MQFTIYQKTATKVPAEIELPVYSAHYMDFSTIYRKMCLGDENKLFVYEIHESLESEQGVEIKRMEITKDRVERNGDYYLGRGEFAGNKENWDEALAMAKAYLAKFT